MIPFASYMLKLVIIIQIVFIYFLIFFLFFPLCYSHPSPAILLPLVFLIVNLFPTIFYYQNIQEAEILQATIYKSTYLKKVTAELINKFGRSHVQDHCNFSIKLMSILLGLSIGNPKARAQTPLVKQPRDLETPNTTVQKSFSAIPISKRDMYRNVGGELH